MRAKITMTEMAELAGVSESTISRALNDSPLVSEATKARVRELSLKHGYAVNATASNLRRQSSGALGLVIPVGQVDHNSVTDPFFLEMIGAVTQSATDNGYDLIVSLPSETGSISRRRLLSTGRADGLIVIGQAGRHDRLNELHDMGLNFAVWGGQLEGQRYTTVGSDNRLGGELAAAHLIALGRTRLLFLGDRDLPEVALRHNGYLRAHQRAGLLPDPALCQPVPFAGETAFNCVAGLVAEGVAFDGICAASDMIALSAIRALGAAGLAVPQHVAVVGYDDLQISAQVTPRITTIRQDIAAGGRRLVDHVLKRIAGEATHSELTDTSLVIRETCGGQSATTT